jgi:hypothetical protein
MKYATQQNQTNRNNDATTQAQDIDAGFLLITIVKVYV